MKSQPQKNIESLMNGQTDQRQVVFFPDNWRSAYSTYTALYSGGILKSDRGRPSFGEMLKHAALLLVWIGALTILVWGNKGELGRKNTIMSPDNAVEANLVRPHKSGTL
jgi:hypothetical protein